MSFRLSVFKVEGIAQGFQGDVIGAFQFDHGLAQLLGAGGDQGFQISLISAVLQLKPAVLHGAPNCGQQLFALERLQQVVIGTIAYGSKGYGDIVNRGHHDHGHVRESFLGALQQPNAIQVGHHQVGEHEFELFAGIEQGDGLKAGSGLPTLIVGVGEHRRDNLADSLLVIDNQDSFNRHKAGLV